MTSRLRSYNVYELENFSTLEQNEVSGLSAATDRRTEHYSCMLCTDSFPMNQGRLLCQVWKRILEEIEFLSDRHQLMVSPQILPRDHNQVHSLPDQPLVEE